MPGTPESSERREPGPARTHRCRGLTADLVFAVAWVASFAMLQWSVVRFRVSIVGTLTVATALLTWWLVRRARIRLTPLSTGVALMAGAAAIVALPMFSYLPPTAGLVTRVVLAETALLAVALIGRRQYRAATVTATVGYLVTAAVAIVTDPAPKIDVWVTLQQASEGLAHGENFYAMTWIGSPGIQDAFTYLPWSAVLLAPGRLLAGDVRWMMAVWTVVMVVGVWRLGAAGRTTTPDAGEHHPRGVWRERLDGPGAAAAVVALILVVPGAVTQIDQSWTEPLLVTGVVWWAVLVRTGRPWWAVVPLALACASKQHLAVLLPVLLVWRAFGVRRTMATGALTAVLIAPWFIASPADFVHDTITLLVGFHPIRFANTLYLLALNTFGVTLPFWLTGMAVLATLALAVWAVWRRQPDLGEVLRWCALVLAVANLVNKQAFYNQYWFVGALVAVSLVVVSGPSGSGEDAEAMQPGRGEVRPALTEDPAPHPRTADSR